jgi:hypothetical protein
MNGRIQGRRARWLQVGLAVAALVAVHALHGGLADAASIRPERVASARISGARDASATPGIVLVAITSQNYPAFFKIAADGQTLTLAAISLDLNCTSGDEAVLPDAFAKVRIKANGRLHATESIPATAGSDGETYSGTDSLTAHLNRRHSQLSGTWRLRLNYNFTNGMSDQCDSGPVRFTATQ